MSTTIDERVVEMRFDNRQFETNVKTSLSTLDKLKQSLNLDGAAKGLDGLSTAAKKCDFSSLSSSVETVQAKFSAFEVVAMTALSNITNSAVNAGKQLLSSLTIDQVSAGWEKFGNKTTSVGTLVSQGYDIETVNEQLERLNWFTDETSYNFTDMVSNIAKFTASGQDLKTSVTALEGIANWAALSGQNAQTASNAMYQLSQAMGSGIMRKEDYKSIQNASMDTDEFRQKALDAGVALGTLKQNLDGTYTSLVNNQGAFTKSQFADHLTQDAWFTSDVMMKVFNDYSAAVDQIYEYAEEKGITASQAIEELGMEVDAFGLKAFKAAQEARTFPDVIDSVKDAVSTGWMNTFELVFGNYEEAKELWTDLANAMYDVFAEGGNARNEMLEGALSYSGWDKFTEAIEDAGIQLDTFEGKLKETADSSGRSLEDIISEAGSLEEAVQQGLISTDMLLEAVGNSADGLSKEQLAALNESLDSIIDGVGELSGRQHLVSAFWNTWEGVGALLSTVQEAFRDIFPATTSEQLYGFVKGLNELTERFRYFVTESEEGLKVMSDLRSTFKGLFAILDIVKQVIVGVVTAFAPMRSVTGGLLTNILGLTGSFGDWLTSIDEAMKKGGMFTTVCQKIADFLETAISKVEAFIQAVRENFKIPGFDTLSGLLERVQDRMSQVVGAATDMKSGVNNAVDEMGSALEGSLFFRLLQSLYNGVKTIASGIMKLIGGIESAVVETIENADFGGLIDLLDSISLGAIAIGIKKFLDSFREVTDSVGSIKESIVGVLDGVKGCFEAWQNDINAKALLKIASAVAILAAALVVLSTIDSEKLTASLLAVGGLFGELMASMAIMDKVDINGKSMSKVGNAMIKMSAALLLMASALKTIAQLEPEQIAAGLVGVGVLLAEIDVFMQTAKFDANASKAATGMILFAAAIKILASAVTTMGGLDWSQLVKGLTGVGVLLAEVEVFLNTAKFSGKSVLTATGIVLLSSAIKVLASACNDFAELSWSELAKGLSAVGALLLEVTAFTKLTGNAKNVVSTGLALIEIAAAMKIFASAMSDFSQLSWEEVAKGLVAMGGALAEVAIAMNVMPKNMIGIGSGLVVVGAALNIMASALGKMGGMSWESIAKSLVAMGGALAELAVGLNFMNGTLAGSAAMLVAAGALAVLTPVLFTLGSVSWESIAKGLITIAGAFTVMGVAGTVLTPLVPTILGLSGALVLISVGVAGLGAGLLLIGTGLSAVAVGITALATSFGAGVTIIVAGLTSIITGIAALIPAIAEKLGEAVVAFAGVITNGAPAIGEAVKALVLTLVDVLVECVPAIADGALKLVAGVLDALVAYTPQIVDSVMQFLIEIIEGLARNLPVLIQAAVDLLMSFFSGIVSALGSIDTNALLKGIAGIGLLSGIMVALGALAGLIPSAMVGVLGLGVVIAELAVVLAAVGALAQIPGLEWLISEGGQLLQTIGSAIGGFVGGIVGGFMSGVSSSFPQIGADLAAFMTNVQPFIDGAGSISPDMLTGVKALTEAVLFITAADLLEGLTSWLTGGSSLSSFAEELVPFGEAMMKFSHSIEGLDGNLVSTAAIAGKTLAEMAATLPNSGGVVGFFAGENDMGEFGNQLVGFGESMMNFAESVKGLDTNAVTNAAIAGKAMAEMAATLPNTGGAVAFFTGDNDMDAFGEQLIPFGEAIKAYSDAVTGLDVDAVTNSAIAGQAMSELANTLPNTGGAVAFFTGNNDLDTFGEQLVSFGESIRTYSQTVSGFDEEAVTASASAGKSLVELANTLPNTGGLVSFFTGDNDLETFGEQIVSFGEAMTEYSAIVANSIDAEAITASANAGLTLVELANTLPKTGDIVNWFTGSNKFETFGEAITPFGEAMAAYSAAVSGKIDAEAVSASVTAGTTLVELAKTLPKTGDLVSWFTGDNKFDVFGEGIAQFGEAMAEYSKSVSGGIDSDAVTASATAGASLVELAKTLPSTGGLLEWFAGGNSLDKFGESIVPFGEAMVEYSNAVSNQIDSGAIVASTNAGKALAELSSTLLGINGLTEWLSSGNGLDRFGESIVPFGEAMAAYSAEVSGKIDAGSINASAVAGQSLAELAASLPAMSGVISWFTGNADLSSFGASITPFGTAIAQYSAAVSGKIDTGSISASATAGQSLVELANTLPSTGGAVAWLTTNDVAMFGEGILAFGESITKYSEIVSGNISTEAVTASVSAGQALVELANTLPKCGGLVSVFAGDSGLAAFSDDIVNFGKDLAAYADAIKDVKPEAVTASANAVGALSNLASGLPDSSLFDKWFGGDQTLASFGKDISEFGEAMNDYYSEISGIDIGKMSGVITQVWSLLELAEGANTFNSSGLTNFAANMKNVGDVGITGFTNAFYNCGDAVNSAVVSMLSSVSSSITSNVSVTNSAMETVVRSMADIVDVKVTVIQSAVGDMMLNISSTITRSSMTIKAAMGAVLTATVSTINSMKSEFDTAGKNVGQGFVNGINSKLGSASSAGRSLGLAALNAAKKALDSHSPSREFIYLGENMGEGLAIGVNNSIVPAAQATSGMIDEVIKVSEKGIDAFEDWIDEKQYYGELSLMDELAGWENLQKKYKAGSEERIKIDREVYRVQNELVAATYQASIDWIEEEKYYNRLSTEEELAAYERMQSRYLEGSEERMEIDRKVYSLRNQLVDESYQNSMDWIEEEQYYGRMSLADELAAYKRVQSRYAKGTEERKKMDREVYRVEQEIYEAQQQYIADVQSVQESANQKRIELEEEYADKVKSINEQLEKDIESLNEQYQSAVESRTKSLYQSYGLFDEVTEKEEVSSETLMKNLEGQVQEFSEWQDILDQLSARGVDSDLISELQEMGPSAIAQIKALNSMSDDELDKYVSLWSLKHAQAREQATSELEYLRIETQDQIVQLRVDAAEELEEYRATWQAQLEQLDEDTNEQLAALRKDFAENVGLIKKDTEAELEEMTEAAQKILTEAGWDETGQQIVTGLTQGVSSQKSSFIDELTNMALAGVEAVKSTLEINSPSRVFRELGNYTGLGFVTGLADYADKSYAAGANMADYATDGLSNAMSVVTELLNGDMDTQPTIRPVLDLSDVERTAGEIDSLFYPQRSIGLVGQASLAFGESGDNGEMTVTVDNDDVVQELRSLRSEMAEMVERMKRMQVVMDTGALVGAMTDPMDAALGQKQSYKGRGI